MTDTIDDPDYQTQLNNATLASFNEAGGSNHIQALFARDLAKVAIDPQNKALVSIQPNVKPMDSVAWSRCLCFVVAFLRRYKMEQTLHTMKYECPILPKNTGFQRASDLKAFIGTLRNTEVVIADKTFDERVIDFREELRKADEEAGIIKEEPPKPKRIKRRKSQK